MRKVGWNEMLAKNRHRRSKVLRKLTEQDALKTPTAQDPTTARKAGAVVGPPTASIVQIYGPDLGRQFVLSSKTVIGRDPSAATITVDLPGVSRRHAELLERDGAWWVSDLGSTNGTFLRDAEILGEARLNSGDVIRIGGAIFKYIAGGDIEALYHEEIYRLTITDGLTGIPNKRHFCELLKREVARARRRDRSLWVVMLDIDHFKQINDTYGHVTGDHLLRKLAQLLAAEVRVEEAMARFGGEEFAVVLPEADASEVRTFCERIRGLVEEHHIVFDHEQHRMTISLGASSLQPGQEVDDLIRAADEQLYRAKNAGRNRACVDVREHEEAS